MSTLIGPGADMSFVGGAYSDKFAVPASHTNEQAGFSRANNMGHGGTLNDSNSYFYMNHHDSFNPRGNHSNAAGARQLGGGPFTAGLTFGKKSMRSSADRISVNPVGGVERQQEMLVAVKDVVVHILKVAQCVDAVIKLEVIVLLEVEVVLLPLVLEVIVMKK